MQIKEKIIGVILIKIDKISTAFTSSKFLSYLMPGEIVYQIILIILGILLIWTMRSRFEAI